MTSRHLQIVLRVRETAILWLPGSGRVFGNARGEALASAEPETVRSLARDAALDRRAAVVTIGGRSMTVLPLIDGPRGSVESVLLIERPVEDLPVLLHELYGVDQHFANLVHLVPQAVLTARPSGAIDFVSRQFYAVTGSRPRGVDTTRRLLDAVINADRHRVASEWAAGIAAGLPFRLRFRITGANGVRWQHLEALPWHDGGRILKWIATLADIDDEVVTNERLGRARARLRLLADVALALTGAVDAGDLLDAVAPLVAAWSGAMCAIELRESSGRLAAVASPSSARLLLERLSQDVQTAAGRDDVRSRDDTKLRVLSGTRVSGFVALCGQLDRTEEAADDETLDDVAERIVEAAERLVAARREREISQVLQRAMLPVALPQVTGIRFDVCYRAADSQAFVGGDWYDAFALPDGRIGLSIGDVAGHGLDAAVVMGRIRQAIRSNAFAHADPGGVMQYASTIAWFERTPLVTAFFGILDPYTLDFAYANAGHPPPLVVGRDGVEPLRIDGPPLGAAEPQALATHRRRLEPHQALVLYTDGLVENERDYLAGERRLLDLFAHWGAAHFSVSASGLHEALLGQRVQHDDAALLIVRTVSVDDVDVTVAANVSDARRVRELVHRFAEDVGCSEDARHDLLLATLEAVNNATEHAYRAAPSGPIRVRVFRDGPDIVVRVTDRGVWRPEVVGPDRGRGLPLMRTLSASLDVVHDRTGTEVCMRFAGPRASISASA